MSDRIACVVPFCRRTAPRLRYEDPDAELICGKHWRMAHPKLRRLHSLNRRRIKRMFESDPKLGKAHARELRLWYWIKRQAIERAMGVA